MPLDKVLINHLDVQDELEDQIEDEIENLISKIKVSDLINNSHDTLIEIANALQDILRLNYYDKATEQGIMLAKDIEEDGDIIINDSNDPNLNEGDIDASQGENKS